jgi:2-hydroxy-6-oxonona-2,4-dienedioate hydrolase
VALTEEGIIAIPGLMSRWVRLASGARAHYTTAGEDGPAVILLHGGIVGSSGTAGWRFMAPFLAQNGFRVYCPDQPGFGLSDTREAFRPALGALSHVEFVREFADAVCADRFFIAGNSMGCSNSVNVAITYPERIIRMALIAGGVGDIVDPNIPRVPGPYNLMEAMAKYDYTPQGMKDMMEPIIYRKEAISEDLLEMRTRSAIAQKENQVALRAGRERIANDPALAQKLSTRGRLDKLTRSIPTIYLYGRNDVLSPVENGYPQEDALPDVQFFYPDECGHQGQTDQPEMFNQVFLEFFRDGKVSRKTADWAGVSKRRAENATIVEQAVPAGV